MIVKRIKKLDGNFVIWRYMSFEKFLNLCITSSLYFSNASKLEDKYEIEIPLKSLEIKKNSLLNLGKSIEKTDFPVFPQK